MKTNNDEGDDNAKNKNESNAKVEIYQRKNSNNEEESEKRKGRMKKQDVDARIQIESIDYNTLIKKSLDWPPCGALSHPIWVLLFC